MENKIFCIGTWKTGTTSMGKALCLALPYAKHPGYTFGAKDLYLNNKITKIKTIADKFSVFDDTPWNCKGIWEKMSTLYPDAVFILTTRNTETWFNSFNKWYVGDMKKFEAIPRAATRNILSLYQRQMPNGINVKTKSHIKENESFWKKWYEDRNQHIREFFKDEPHRLLEYAVDENLGWDPICNFLNVPKPQEPFPHLNKNKRK